MEDIYLQLQTIKTVYRTSVDHGLLTKSEYKFLATQRINDLKTHKMHSRHSKMKFPDKQQMIETTAMNNKKKTVAELLLFFKSLYQITV